MFKTILAPTDGSLLSDKALQAALKFAKENGSSLVVISVATIYPFPLAVEGGMVPDLSAYEETVRSTCRGHAEKAAATAKAAGVPCKTVVVDGFSAHEEIINAARDHGCDLIWMASHGRKGVDRMLMGSETQKVLAHATIPVLVYR